MAERPTPRAIPNRGLEDGVVRILVDRIDMLEKRLDDLGEAWANIGDRLELVETRDRSRGTGVRSLDDVALATVRFLEAHPGQLHTALTIAENADLDHHQVGTRLRTLAGRDLVEMIVREGRTTMWRAAAKAPEAVASDA